MVIQVKELKLATARDCRKLGAQLENTMRKIIELNYGVYTIEEDYKHLFLIIENFLDFQVENNKGVRVIGDFGTKKLEIYNMQKDQQEMDDMVLDLDL